MNLKQKMKNFFTLTRKADGGFTLVELIVVIAILAILGGVAVPAYSGYVKKANMQADISLASDVAQALMLKYYADPLNAPTTPVAVILGTDKALAAEGDGQAFAAEAMKAVFGDNWQTAAKLSYDKWGNGTAVTQEVIEYFMTVTDPDDPLYDIFNGNADISYTDNIPELFDLMEDTAILIAGKRSSLGSGANMVTNASAKTMNLDAEVFSEKWATSAWDSSYLMDDCGAEYSGNTSSYTDQQLEYAIANAAVIKARNVALATYLAEQGFEDMYSVFADYNYTDTVVPNDAAAVMFKWINQTTPSDEDMEFIYMLAEKDEEYTDELEAAVRAYYNSDNGPSQAYTDGLAYYAMMSTVDYLGDNSSNLDTSSDETWWNDLYSAVDMYSSVANGEASLADLNNLYSNMGTVSGNTVLVMLMVQNGVPTVMISPVDANP